MLASDLIQDIRKVPEVRNEISHFIRWVSEEYQEYVVTVKHEEQVWMLIHGMNAGMFTKELDCDCLIIRKNILEERIPFAETALEMEEIKSFEIIEFEITEKGITKE